MSRAVIPGGAGFLHQVTLHPLHAPAFGWRRVIKSCQMEQAVQQVQLHFSDDAAVKYSGLRRGRIGADHDFTVLKCEDIGGDRNAAEFIVQRSNSPIAYNHDVDVIERRDLAFRTPCLPYKFAGNSSEAL